jgi:hypothetical protein
MPPRTTGGNQYTVLNLKIRGKSAAWADLGKIKQSLPYLLRHRRA